MDAIELLKNQHAVIRNLLVELTTAAVTVERRSQLLDLSAREILIHTQIEEEIFYPAFRSVRDACRNERFFFESVEEHRTAAELVLPDLLATAVSSNQFAPRARILRELVDRHMEEEEVVMLPRAKESMDHNDLASLGAALKARRDELVALELSQLLAYRHTVTAAERAVRRASISAVEETCDRVRALALDLAFQRSRRRRGQCHA